MSAPELDASPEFRAAIEEGLLSAETEPLIPLEQVRGKIAKWAGLSPDDSSDGSHQ